MRVAVDAFNLAADRRGMGRAVRTTLGYLREGPGVAIALVARNPRSARELGEEFGFETLLPDGLRSASFDAVWYPWNGMRFDPHSRAIVTLHDPFAFTFPARNFIARRREQSPIRRAIRCADRFLAVSGWTGSQLQSLFGVPKERITISPPARDPFWCPVPGSDRAPFVLFVAGPDKRKNAPFFFRAFEAAFECAREPVLVVAGSLSDEDERALSGAQFPHERVKPDDKELRELYSSALAVGVPSLAEGFGLPAIEAMACGAPVVASNAAALPETCAGAALLADPNDLHEWSNALRRIMDDASLRADLRTRGLARANAIDPGGPANALLECVRRFRADAR